MKIAIGFASSKDVKVKTDKKEKVLKMLLDSGFHNAQKPKYRLWKLKGSESTLYIRSYDDKLECLIFGDFDPYVYLRIKYEEVLKRIDCGENIFQILLKDKI